MKNASFWNMAHMFEFVTTELWIGRCCSSDGAPGQPDSLPLVDNLRTAYRPKGPVSMRISRLIFLDVRSSVLHQRSCRESLFHAESVFRPKKIRRATLQPRSEHPVQNEARSARPLIRRGNIMSCSLRICGTSRVLRSYGAH
jgi:hypothetical protein